MEIACWVFAFAAQSALAFTTVSIPTESKRVLKGLDNITNAQLEKYFFELSHNQEPLELANVSQEFEKEPVYSRFADRLPADVVSFFVGELGSFDRNHDGLITRQEFIDGVRAQFPDIRQAILNTPAGLCDNADKAVKACKSKMPKNNFEVASRAAKLCYYGMKVEFAQKMVAASNCDDIAGQFAKSGVSGVHKRSIEVITICALIVLIVWFPFWLSLASAILLNVIKIGTVLIAAYIVYWLVLTVGGYRPMSLADIINSIIHH